VKRTLVRTNAFSRDLRKWLKSHPDAEPSIAASLELLLTDPAHPALRTHKLYGSMAGSWACSAGYDLRIVFDYGLLSGEAVIFLLAIGTHDEVY